MKSILALTVLMALVSTAHAFEDTRPKVHVKSHEEVARELYGVLLANPRPMDNKLEKQLLNVLAVEYPGSVKGDTAMRSYGVETTSYDSRGEDVLVKKSSSEIQILRTWIERKEPKIRFHSTFQKDWSPKSNDEWRAFDDLETIVSMQIIDQTTTITDFRFTLADRLKLLATEAKSFSRSARYITPKSFETYQDEWAKIWVDKNLNVDQQLAQTKELDDQVSAPLKLQSPEMPISNKNVTASKARTALVQVLMSQCRDNGEFARKFVAASSKMSNIPLLKLSAKGCYLARVIHEDEKKSAGATKTIDMDSGRRVESEGGWRVQPIATKDLEEVRKAMSLFAKKMAKDFKTLSDADGNGEGFKALTSVLLNVLP